MKRKEIFLLSAIAFSGLFILGLRLNLLSNKSLDKGADIFIPSTSCLADLNRDSVNCTEPAMKVTNYGSAYLIGDTMNAVGTVSLIGISAPTILSANFDDFPDPQPGLFYEGWLIHKASGEVISTGRLIKKSNVWHNNYVSETKLSVYDQYILTTETEGGGSGSEEHVAVADIVKTGVTE